MLQHFLRVEVRNQEGDVISLLRQSVSTLVRGARSPRGPAASKSADQPLQPHTLIGFRLRMKKDSARCSKNRVNLCTRMCSISSACLILMLIRTLLMLGSMRTRSFSFRAIVRGARRTSGDVLASTSGTLCRSAVWDAKLERQRAAVRLLRTAWRYGLRD